MKRLPIALLVLACDSADLVGADDTHVTPHHDHAHEATGTAQISGAVTCPASMTRYPVAGKHNGGWDSNALTYTCPTHPSSSKDNSDFLAGDHYGNDIFAAKGTPLVACVKGTIVGKSTTTIGGKNVSIKDACGWHYYYAHLDTFAPGLAVGQAVEAGDPLGTVGNTGNASGTSPHLHFSVHPANYTAGIDPFPLLQKVDATACTGGAPPTPPGVNPDTANISITSSTAPADTLSQGPSGGIADVFEGQTFHVDVVVGNAAGGKNTSDYVRLGYWVESPWLEVATWQIHTDWPAKDKSTWVLNDADSAPDNPPKNDPPATGQMNLYAIAQGETKRIRFTVRAVNYSLGAVDHPDLRAWVWHVGNYYGEMTGWDDPVEVNKAGKLLRTYVQHDVYGATHWEWNGAPEETEGWGAANAVSLTVDGAEDALFVEQLGPDPYMVSPGVALAASQWGGFHARVRHHDGTKAGQLFWATTDAPGFSEERSLHYEVPGDGQWHEIALNPSTKPGWTGTITRIRIDPTWAETGRFDLDWLRAVAAPGPTTGDADGDGKLASSDCNDNDPNLQDPTATPEVCDGVDNDCDGLIDEELSMGAEVCDGVDSNCNGTLMPGEEDADLDGHAPCKGDCNDADPAVHPGATELCDGFDNDCDGTTDDGFTLGASCTVGTGACAASGVVGCSDEGGVRCTGAPALPEDETCNGLDDDCDGATDEDWGLGGSCSAGGPGCLRVGVTRCSADGQFICDAMPPSPLPEKCNGLDDDCDGLTDEGLAQGDPCTVGAGACASTGVTGCRAEGLVCLAEASAPGPERCNGLDDDCDGDIDDGFPIGQTCEVLSLTSPSGAPETCRGVGVWVCAPSGERVACDAPCEAATSPESGLLADVVSGDTAPSGAGSGASGSSGCSGAARPTPGWGGAVLVWLAWRVARRRGRLH